jgi:hypothetical protein
MTNPEERVLALSIGGVVCIAASNGGTTSQDLKTGYLLGATPRKQQYAILIGALTSAIVIGFTLVVFNNSKTIRSENADYFPKVPDRVTHYLLDPANKIESTTRDGIKLVQWTSGADLPESEREKALSTRPKTEPTGYWVEIIEEKVPPKEGEEDKKAETIKVGRVRYLIGADMANRKTEEFKDQTYRVWWAVSPDFPGKPIRMLVTDEGKLAVRVDKAIMGQLTERVREDGTVEEVKRPFDAPKTQVMGNIINGVLKQDLNWSMVLIGALIAVTLELCGVSSLAFAVGLYVPIQFSTPIFIGGSIRWIIETVTRKRDKGTGPKDEVTAIAQEETSPAVLLSSGYIAGGSLAGMLVAFLEFSEPLKNSLDVTEPVKITAESSWIERLRDKIFPDAINTKLPMNQYWIPLAAFAVLAVILLFVGLRKRKNN